MKTRHTIKELAIQQSCYKVETTEHQSIKLSFYQFLQNADTFNALFVLRSAGKGRSSQITN